MAELAASPHVSTPGMARRVTRSASTVTAFAAPWHARALHILHRAAVAAAILVLVTVVVLTAFRDRYDGRVLPSVVVADVDVGGLSQPDAEAAVAARASSVLTAPLTFTYEGRSWTPTLAELGVTSDAETAVAVAFGIGRETAARERLASSFDATHRTQYVPLPMAVDHAAAVRWADTVTEELGAAPVNARIEVSADEVTLHPDVDGVVVDAARLGEIIRGAVATMSPYEGPLPILHVGADRTVGDIQPAADRLAAALSEPISVVHKKKHWTLQPADLATFVRQVDTPDGSGITVDLDQAALADWLRSLLSEPLNRDARDAVVAWNGDRLGVVENSRDGLRVRPDSLAADVADSFFGDHASVSIPVRIIKPAIDSDRLEDLRIETELGRGSSNFQGSNDGRATNVIIGTEHLNGAMVPPGGQFSFNEAIGDIVTDRGYVEADVIQGERIGKDIGGGICQVSTTIFRSAYQAGLPMVEWNPHLYRLGFYELDGYQPGFDASILQEGPRELWGDFRFANPTDGWLLIEAYVVDVQVVVVIYGPDTGWDIDFTEPVLDATGLKAEDQEEIEIVNPELESGTVQLAELPIDGLIVTHSRTVRDAEGEVIDDFLFYTRFAPRGNVYKVSPDMEGQSPASLQDESESGG